jgi:6-pyruvoyl-tetrahydropterin synthase
MRLPIIFALIFITAYSAVGQNNPGNPLAENLAKKIADRMKDSLALTEQQRNSIFDINMQLHNQKMEKRKHYANDPLLGNHLQKVENTRDSLYRAVLPEDKFILYKKKRTNIVNNN